MESTTCSGAPVCREQGSSLNRGATSWRAHGHQGGTGPKASACVRDRGEHTVVITSPTAIRPAGRARRTDGTQREEGEDFEGPWDARRLGRREAWMPRVVRRAHGRG
jgi:hypothetical protein